MTGLNWPTGYANLDGLIDDLKNWHPTPVTVEKVSIATWVIRGVYPGMDADVSESVRDFDGRVIHVVGRDFYITF